MKAFVFTDKALAGEAGRFVWLELNTEKPGNAAIRAQLKVQALPTYFIVNPDSESVILRRVGAATVPQLLAILEDGRETYAAAGGALSPADAALARAEQLFGAGENGAAAAAYREALAAAPADWPPYGRAVESALFAMSMVEEYEPAAELARDAYPRLRATPAGAGVAGTGLDCALSLPADHPERAALVSVLEAASLEAVNDPASPAAADDRSSVFGTLVGARADAGDSTGARAMAERWAAFLDAEAGKAVTPEERTVFDSHRLSAYLELGQAERAIPVLEASERALPDDYNPPARLAVAYLNLKRWDDGLAAADRALARAYGPRKLRIYSTKADLLAGMGDPGAARATLEEALAFAESFPEGQRSEATIRNLKKRIESIGAAAKS